jgi:zinc protease
VDAARALVLKDLKQMQNEPVADADLQRAKGILLRRVPLSESSFGSIANQLLTYAERGQPLDQGIVSARHYLELTAPDVQQAYAKHVRLDGFVTAVKGPASKGLGAPAAP